VHCKFYDGEIGESVIHLCPNYRLLLS